MLGVGWTEMLVIGVVALIVIGPKELPALMHRIGKFAGTVRRMGADSPRQRNPTTGLDEVKNLRNAKTQPLKSTTDAIRKEFNTTTPTGEVRPSGALKPADPKAESVVSEIHKQAGMATPAEPVKGAPVKAATAPVAIEPAKAAPTAPVTSTSLAAPAAASAGVATSSEPAKSVAMAAAAPSTVSPPTAAKPKPKRVRKPKASAADAESSRPRKPRPAKSPASKPVASTGQAEKTLFDEPDKPARKRAPAKKTT